MGLTEEDACMKVLILALAVLAPAWVAEAKADEPTYAVTVQLTDV